MKKIKQIHKPSPKMSPEQVLMFLEDFGQIVHGKDSKTKLISLRVPENILNSFKVKSQQEQRKYQSVIVQLMREWVLKRT